ncbi:MAG: response regulator [Phototrophicaceae bacterium]
MGTILVVEDDEQNHILMDSLLQSMGHDVLHAHNGQQGLEIADKYRPDLILLDMRLPLRNGWEVARLIKNDSQLGQIPIVGVSVAVNRDDEQKALNAGCDAFISKPFPIQLMRDCINFYLK